MNDITAEFVRSILRYEPDTGLLYWKVSLARRIRVGSVAGTRRKDGYVQIGIAGRLYLAHRLAWLIVTGDWPDELIDHRELNPGDNRWDSLRAASNAQNLSNRGAPRNSKTGIKGVYRRTDCNRWSAFIKANGKSRYLGLFQSADAAASAYRQAAATLHGEFARAG